MRSSALLVEAADAGRFLAGEALRLAAVVGLLLSAFFFFFFFFLSPAIGVVAPKAGRTACERATTTSTASGLGDDPTKGGQGWCLMPYCRGREEGISRRGIYDSISSRGASWCQPKAHRL